ncbi:MAG: aromatic ring-hydroxylating dioxygenase subunit alpha, partial [Alphaproteobacteria bacterium]
MMEGSAAINDLAALVDDRPGDGVFRIDRAVYTDPTVYEAELDGIFRGGWVYLCHESEIANTGDYCATHMGVDPVLVTRAKDGAVRGFINACTHRGALLTQCRRGNAGALTCRFHGWSYALDGRCLRVKNEAEGYGEAEVDRAPFDLTPIGRVESYRGFVFGSMTEEVPPLADYLGAAKAWIDLIADQSPDGLEVVPGSSTYVIWGNWKMQAENGVDGYHVSTVH